MRMDWITGLLAMGLTLAACSPEERPRDAAPETPGAAVEATKEVAAGGNVSPRRDPPSERPAAEPETRVDPDPQAGVEFPEPPVRVPESPSAG